MERWVPTRRRELLDRTLIWNQRHLRHLLRGFSPAPLEAVRRRREGSETSDGDAHLDFGVSEEQWSSCRKERNRHTSRAG
jgi:hypothetical protein